MKIVNGKICLFATIFLIVLLHNESGGAAVQKSGGAVVQKSGRAEVKRCVKKEDKEKAGYVIMFWNLENYYDTFNDPATSDDEFTPFGDKYWSWKKFVTKRNNIAKVIISVGERQGEGGGYGGKKEGKKEGGKEGRKEGGEEGGEEGGKEGRKEGGEEGRKEGGKEGGEEGGEEQKWGEVNYPCLVALAEVENRFVLEQLVRNTPLSLINYGVIHRDSPDNRGIDVALLYRKKVFRPLSIDFIYVRLPDSTAKTRLILYTKGVFEDLDTIHVFVNHWPSKFGGEDISRPNREAAAKTLRNKCDSILKSSHNANILLTGDFNDTPDAPVFNPFKDFVNLSITLFKAGTGTIKYMGKWELIDQFFVSKNLLNIDEPICCDVKSMKIYNPFFLLEPDKEYLGVKPKRSYIGPRYNGGISDHLPILITIGKM